MRRISPSGFARYSESPSSALDANGGLLRVVAMTRGVIAAKPRWYRESCPFRPWTEGALS